MEEMRYMPLFKTYITEKMIPMPHGYAWAVDRCRRQTKEGELNLNELRDRQKVCE